MTRKLARALTIEEQTELAETYRSGSDADLVRRCHAVLLAGDGLSVPKVGELLRVNQSTVHRWLDRFELGGLEALVTGRRDGRPPRWNEEYEHLLVDTVRHDPRWYGLEQSVWTCPLLAGYLAQRSGIAMSAERVRVILHQHGLRLKQPTPVVHSKDPQYDPKGLESR
jgi:transposase